MAVRWFVVSVLMSTSYVLLIGLASSTGETNHDLYSERSTYSKYLVPGTVSLI